MRIAARPPWSRQSKGGGRRLTTLLVGCVAFLVGLILLATIRSFAYRHDDIGQTVPKVLQQQQQEPPGKNGEQQCVDTLPVCARASGNPYVLDSENRKVLNEVALFFCPCLSQSLGAGAPPREVSLKVWRTVVDSLDPGQEEVLINLTMDSKLYVSRNSAISSVVPKGYLNVWSTRKDEGVPVVIDEMRNLGYFSGGVFNDNELAIDIGSNTGIITILLAWKKRNVLIMAVEAVSFTWMYQQVNLWANLPAEWLQSGGRIRSVLAGLSDSDGNNLRFQFRDDSLTSSRSWNPSSENSRTLCMVSVRTRSLNSLLDEIFPIANRPPICWIKVDCEGCEYAFIPHMSQQEFDAVKSWTGELHYQHMKEFSPDKSLIPPLATVQFTHDRLCRFFQCNQNDLTVF